jgi:hypothetical protein
MNRNPVTSSNLASIGYDPETKVLQVEFKKGTIYDYADVPPVVANDLVHAESIGKAFHSLVIQGGYIATKVAA